MSQPKYSAGSVLPKEINIRGESGTIYTFKTQKRSDTYKRDGELPLTVYKISKINDVEHTVKKGKLKPDFNFVNSVFVKTTGKVLRPSGKIPLPLMHITIPRNRDGSVKYETIHITGEVGSSRFMHRFYKAHAFLNMQIDGNNAVRNSQGRPVAPKLNKITVSNVAEDQALYILDQTVEKLKQHVKRSATTAPSVSSGERKLIQAIRKSVMKQNERKAEEALIKLLRQKKMKKKITETMDSRVLKKKGVRKTISKSHKPYKSYKLK